MFILYALVIGLVAGALLGGRWLALGTITFRWAPLIVIGLVSQVVLFSSAVAERIGDAGPAVYVVTTLMVGVAVVRNIGIPGMPLIVLGAVSNMSAILANNGFMPAAPEALASLGKTASAIYSNSAVVAHPALELLTDRFALPRWLPLANVFSIGDVLIGAGAITLIVVTMRRGRRTGPQVTSAGSPGDPSGEALPAPGAALH